MKIQGKITDLEKELLRVLELAYGHLEYCNYGDRWERECAQEIGLEKQIEAVFRLARGND